MGGSATGGRERHPLARCEVLSCGCGRCAIGPYKGQPCSGQPGCGLGIPCWLPPCRCVGPSSLPLSHAGRQRWQCRARVQARRPGPAGERRTATGPPWEEGGRRVPLYPTPPTWMGATATTKIREGVLKREQEGCLSLSHHDGWLLAASCGVHHSHCSPATTAATLEPPGACTGLCCSPLPPTSLSSRCPAVCAQLLAEVQAFLGSSGARATPAALAVHLHGAGYVATVRRSLSSPNPVQATSTLRNDFLVVAPPVGGEHRTARMVAPSTRPPTLLIAASCGRATCLALGCSLACMNGVGLLDCALW